MLALLEIARIYKALQGPKTFFLTCKDPSVIKIPKIKG